jgi:hypothetical protein
MLRSPIRHESTAKLGKLLNAKTAMRTICQKINDLKQNIHAAISAGNDMDILSVLRYINA